MNEQNDNSLIINNINIRQRLLFPTGKARPALKLHVTPPDGKPDIPPPAPRRRSIFNLEA